MQALSPSSTVLSDGALARFLGGAPTAEGLVVKIDAARWAKDVEPEKELGARGTFLAMRDAIRSLPWADRGVLLKTCTDENGRDWLVRTYATRNIYILAWLRINREGEEI
jgi:hypothetical protein